MPDAEREAIERANALALLPRLKAFRGAHMAAVSRFTSPSE